MAPCFFSSSRRKIQREFAYFLCLSSWFNSYLRGMCIWIHLSHKTIKHNAITVRMMTTLTVLTKTATATDHVPVSQALCQLGTGDPSSNQQTGL